MQELWRSLRGAAVDPNFWSRRLPYRALKVRACRTALVNSMRMNVQVVNFACGVHLFTNHVATLSFVSHSPPV